MAWTSPRFTDRSTPVSALTPGNVVVMSRICRIGDCSAMLAPSPVGAARPAAPWDRSRRDGRRLLQPELLGGVELRLHEGGLDGVGGDHLRREQEGRDGLDAVVVRLGVVDLHLLTGDDLA